MMNAIKRFLLTCLGMLLLGVAGLLLLHGTFEAPPAARAQQDEDPLAIPPPPQPPAGSAHFKDLIPALLDAMTDSEGGVRQLAAATLVRIGPEAVGPLTTALTAKDRETRANAAYVLGHLGDQAEEALPVLAKALKDEDKEVRRRVAYAIHNIVSRSGASASSNGGYPDTRSLGWMPVATPVMASPSGGPSLAGIAGSPDPGLLVPATPPPAKPEKPEKR